MQTISYLSNACNAKLLGEGLNMVIEHIITDSRNIANQSDILFVCLITKYNDGHDFITEAYKKGVRAFLVSKNIDPKSYPNAVFLVVSDTLSGLQQIATKVRKHFKAPVVGITGSNGKTIVKEWLFQLLHTQYSILRNPSSFNSQIGVPLSVWPLSDHFDLGIFEAGISEPNEMDLLENIIQPTIGVFTNIGSAHDQGFINKKQKIAEKLKLFKNSKILIYCKDFIELNECVLLSKKSNETFTWSYQNEADLKVKSVLKEKNKTQIVALYQGNQVEIHIPFVDSASIENAINCWCVLLFLNISPAQINKGMAELKPISMRLELLNADNNCLIINDTYNSDFTSLIIALEMLNQQKQLDKRTVILSDMEQTGMKDEDLFVDIYKALYANNVDRFVGIGQAFDEQKKIFQSDGVLECYFFPNTHDFLKELGSFSFKDEAILIKGSRSFAFEKIVLLLEHKIHQTVLTVNLSSLKNNLTVYRRKVKPNVKIMAMVKALSYGSGGFEIAQVLQESKVDYLSVAYPDEGVSLRRAKIDIPIMVMSPATDSFDRMILWNLEPEIFNIRSLKHFISVAHDLGTKAYPIHIKLDTGMHRLGFMANEIDELLALIRNEECLKVVSIFSHLAASDDNSFSHFTHQQATLFKELCNRIKFELGYAPLEHLCNSAGIAKYPEYHFDMVRLGLGLYGIESSNTLNNQLEQISTLKTTIAQIKQIAAGETIGYSRRGIALKEMRIATICIGYADGYARSISNGVSYVLINNQHAKLIGSIAMDMCMVDITEIEGVQEGDEVVVFGATLPIQLVADWAGTIPYEIMTSISQRVKRVYINEG